MGFAGQQVCPPALSPCQGQSSLGVWYHTPAPNAVSAPSGALPHNTEHLISKVSATDESSTMKLYDSALTSDFLQLISPAEYILQLRAISLTQPTRNAVSKHASTNSLGCLSQIPFPSLSTKKLACSGKGSSKALLGLTPLDRDQIPLAPSTCWVDPSSPNRHRCC